MCHIFFIQSYSCQRAIWISDVIVVKNIDVSTNTEFNDNENDKERQELQK